MRLFFTISIVICLATLISGNNLPDGYFGAFSLDHSENFDAYLSAKGLLMLKFRCFPLFTCRCPLDIAALSLVNECECGLHKGEWIQWYERSVWMPFEPLITTGRPGLFQLRLPHYLERHSVMKLRLKRWTKTCGMCLWKFVPFLLFFEIINSS